MIKYFALALFIVFVSLFGFAVSPAPHSDYFNEVVYRLPMPSGTYERLTADSILSVVEVSEAICLSSREVKLNDNHFHCLISENWVGPKSIALL